MRNIRRRSFLKMVGLAAGAKGISGDALPQQPGPNTSGSPAAPKIEAPLTPESLEMPRIRIIFSGRRLRLFNGRGSISVQDWTVTGVQTPEFPPIALRDYCFELAWRDDRNNVLIQDVTGDEHQRRAITGEGPTPLGDNFLPHSPFVMLLQQARWQPNLYYRTGTFHKLIRGEWISFRVQTWASVSGKRDEVYLKVRIRNRESTPLVLTVMPVQKIVAYALLSPHEKSQTSVSVTTPDAYTLAGKEFRITAISDLPTHGEEGWKWQIPAGGVATARFALIFQSPHVQSPDLYAPDLAARMAAADRAVRDRLSWASEKLPRVYTANKKLDELYYRCMLSVLDARWERENFIIQPFYSVGTWLFTIAWDTSYASEMLAMLDPTGLRQTLLEYIRAGLLTVSYVPWNGHPGNYWYVQTPFAAMRILTDYMVQTGDMGILNTKVDGSTVFEMMKGVGEEIHQRYARPDGLLDFGAGSQKFLEIRTDGYQHAVAADNGLAAAYFCQIAAWCRSRSDPDAAKFDCWAQQLQKAMSEKLWNKQIGWFENLYPDGSLHLVWSYHLYDLLGSGVLSAQQQEEMISHLKEGEFLGPYGMYSIAKQDTVHWDLMDEDWGGGGQYTGMPLRIAESLYRLGYSELGWNIFSRCSRWTGRYPYISQDAFTDEIIDLNGEDMPLEIASGSGVQAVVFGVFGLRPAIDGTLKISPSYHKELGEARLVGYHFRGHAYDIVMNPWTYCVFRDGKLAAQNPYGKTAVFPIESG